MTSSRELEASVAQRILAARKALENGKLKFPPELSHCADELLSAPLTITGLVDTSGLSRQTMTLAKSAGMAFALQDDAERKEPTQKTPSISMSEIQSQLFEHFSTLFGALVGRAASLVKDESEIRNRMMSRVSEEPQKFREITTNAMNALGEFYDSHSMDMFRHAKRLGGMRLVTGEQRMFGPSALNAVRITGLYADTQLIPDPVYPFMHGSLGLNAVQLQLAIQLFQILKLCPLVDLELPVPPVFVFPSFEEQLEERDAHTKLGLEELAMRLLGPLCDGTMTGLKDVFEYAKKREAAFLSSLMASGLFVPPKESPGDRWTPEEAAGLYISALEGIRSNDQLNTLKGLPTGVLLANATFERIRPQYHLQENAAELGAQPLFSQAVHWHYFERIAEANATELRAKNVISQQSLHTLRSVQDDSLSWLATIPVETLASLISQGEHRWLREELDKVTKHLNHDGEFDSNEMIREVNHGLAMLVQRQREALKEIERKHAPKIASIMTGGMTGLGLSASALLIPSLSPYLGVAVPLASAAAAVGGAAVGMARDKAAELTEKKQLKHSMLGVLAMIRPT
ncbi:hypothetical protein [Xanthomonas hortorum]|uniref:hypothetical protein n=2 Tax=Xanthomonas hortorum TaxID=56454 RepID=UPI0015D5CA4E|nr:hypothetical protein [Xanthomonas hortorum]MDT7819574.1 hypothetical protein [Xanthomonas hortorum pv. vitians]NMI38999.1 hypothetical protein [Xanthomonas hortorum pv. vitians]